MPVEGFDPAVFRQQRLDAGLSLHQLARGAGVGRQTVADWESGKHAPSQKVYPQVLDLLWNRVGVMVECAGCQRRQSFGLPDQAERIMAESGWGTLRHHRLCPPCIERLLRLLRKGGTE